VRLLRRESHFLVENDIMIKCQLVMRELEQEKAENPGGGGGTQIKNESERGK